MSHCGEDGCPQCEIEDMLASFKRQGVPGDLIEHMFGIAMDEVYRGPEYAEEQALTQCSLEREKKYGF